MLMFAAGPAFAEWKALGSDGIAAHLRGAEVVYDEDTWQQFLASGRTLYRVGQPPYVDASWGDWRAENDRYCSRWSPGAQWDCYVVEVDGAGGIRFVDEWGNVSAGQFVTAIGEGASE